ncbi:MAG: hypothetical protein AB8B84_13305 [Granulosicoccus sp.]
MSRLFANFMLVVFSLVSGQVLAHADSTVHFHHEYTAMALTMAMVVVFAVLKRKKLVAVKSNTPK